MKEGVSIDDLDDLLKRVCEVEDKNEEMLEGMAKSKKSGADGNTTLELKIKEMEQSINAIGKSLTFFSNAFHRK
jgi:hypothetical protein